MFFGTVSFFFRIKSTSNNALSTLMLSMKNASRNLSEINEYHYDSFGQNEWCIFFLTKFGKNRTSEKKIALMHVYHQTKCLKLLSFKSLKNSEGLWQKVKIRDKTICPNFRYWKNTLIDNCIPDKIFCTCKNLTIAYMYMINFICQHSLQWTPFFLFKLRLYHIILI